jgi:quinol monooxygenase YgiN
MAAFRIEELSAMVVIGAIMHVNKGKEDQFIAEYRKIAPNVLADPGAISYVLHRDTGDPSTFFFYEQYENDDAVRYHSSTAHFKEFFTAIGTITQGRPEIHRYEVV